MRTQEIIDELRRSIAQRKRARVRICFWIALLTALAVVYIFESITIFAPGC